ncbi:MAG: DUF3426 domain-containing protein, partial [Pseudomonadota bacterium]|nr:DUF3426 domain-containing protein [Pseudomonadota bacterium]
PPPPPPPPPPPVVPPPALDEVALRIPYAAPSLGPSARGERTPSASVAWTTSELQQWREVRANWAARQDAAARASQAGKAQAGGDTEGASAAPTPAAPVPVPAAPPASVPAPEPPAPASDAEPPSSPPASARERFRRRRAGPPQGEGAASEAPPGSGANTGSTPSPAEGSTAVHPPVQPVPVPDARPRVSAPVDFVLSDMGRDMGGLDDGAAAPLPTARRQPAPSFVAAARRRAFWASRPVRVVLWLALVGLALGLALQWVVGQRDWLAARHPQLAPALQALCKPLGCQLAPYRRLDAVVIDSSAFQRTGETTFAFSVTLRNHASLPVATPALELTLTDVTDQAVVRRVLGPADVGAPAALAARGEFSGTNALTLRGVGNPQAIVGYRLTAFYP